MVKPRFKTRSIWTQIDLEYDIENSRFRIFKTPLLTRIKRMGRSENKQSFGKSHFMSLISEPSTNTLPGSKSRDQ